MYAMKYAISYTVICIDDRLNLFNNESTLVGNAIKTDRRTDAPTDAATNERMNGLSTRSSARE